MIRDLPIPDYKIQLVTLNKTLAELCRQSRLDYLRMQRVLGGLLADRAGELDKVQATLSKWKAERAEQLKTAQPKIQAVLNNYSITGTAAHTKQTESSKPKE